jgi:hypothetical protein
VNEVAVGRLIEIWRYPVKSMAGESLPPADVSWQGLAGDRRWAFIRPGIPRSGFSWLTIRQQPRMWHYHPAFAEPGDPDRSPMSVRTTDGRELDVTDPRVAPELGDDLRVIKQDRGIFDSLPRSLITTRSIADLEGLLELDGGELDARRFRPNLLVAPSGAARPGGRLARRRAADRPDADARRSPGSRARRPGPGVSNPRLGAPLPGLRQLWPARRARSESDSWGRALEPG